MVISDHRGSRAGLRRLGLASPGLLLAGVVVLAVAVRLAGIESRVDIDEAYSWLVASSPSAHVFLHRLAANENTPPLFYLLLMLAPGDQAAWLRVPAAVPGILACVVVFYALRRRVGDGVSLLAALAVGVSPYLVTYSDLARGFMLADLALLVALWAVLSLSERETLIKWGVLFVAGAIAVWTEYASAIFLIALTLSALWIGVPRRWPIALVGALMLLALAPWIPQIVRGNNQVGVTKFNPMNATPSVAALRDAAVTLTFGESGGTSSSVGRWLVCALMLAVAAGAVVVFRRGWDARTLRERRPIRLIAATTLLTLVGYALAGAFGVGVFSQRYMTILIPLVAILGAAALAAVGKRWLMIAAIVLLVGLGLAGVARRYGGEWQPDLSPVRIAAVAVHPRTVLTNTPVVLYYLQALHPQFDRPYNLGPGRAMTCARPCLIIDDTRVPGGTARKAAGAQIEIGPFLLTLER